MTRKPKTTRSENRDLRLQLKKFIGNFMAEHGVRPDYAAISERFGWDDGQKTYHKIRYKLSALKRETGLDWNALPAGYYKGASYRSIQHLDAPCGRLNAMQKKVLMEIKAIQGRDGQMPTFQAVGTKLGISRERVRQLVERSIIQKIARWITTLEVDEVDPLGDLSVPAQRMFVEVARRLERNASVFTEPPLSLSLPSLLPFVYPGFADGNRYNRLSEMVAELVNLDYLRRIHDEWPRGFNMTEKGAAAFEAYKNLALELPGAPTSGSIPASIRNPEKRRKGKPAVKTEGAPGGRPEEEQKARRPERDD